MPNRPRNLPKPEIIAPQLIARWQAFARAYVAATVTLPPIQLPQLKPRKR
jgi:hypothetical protein